MAPEDSRTPMVTLPLSPDLLRRVGMGAERERGRSQHEGLNEHGLLHGDSCE